MTTYTRLDADESDLSTDNKAIADTQACPEQEHAAAFIEFWVWHDGDLLPATDDELVWIRERERELEARHRLWQLMQADPPRSPLQRIFHALTGTLFGRLDTSVRARAWHTTGKDVTRPNRREDAPARTG